MPAYGLSDFEFRISNFGAKATERAGGVFAVGTPGGFCRLRHRADGAVPACGDANEARQEPPGAAKPSNGLLPRTVLRHVDGEARRRGDSDLAIRRPDAAAHSARSGEPGSNS